MNPQFILKVCAGCKHSLMQLAPDKSVRFASCSHARDNSTAAVKSRPRPQDAVKMTACPLETAKAVAA